MGLAFPEEYRPCSSTLLQALYRKAIQYMSRLTAAPPISLICVLYLLQLSG